MSELDKFDLKLLAELEQDARQTFSQMAKRLKTSQQVISYRIKSLENRNIVGGYYAIINITKLGYTSYRTMLRLSNIDEQKHREIIAYLMKHPNVLWLVDCGGRWDLLVNFMAKNIIQYQSILREFRTAFPEQIQNYDVLTTVEIIYFGRDYFTKKEREIKPLPRLGGEFETVTLDRTNLQILDLLSEHARMPATEIGQKIGISPNTVMLRIKDMRKQGIIQGFKPLIRLENTPYSGYKALIKFQNITENKEKEIINFLSSNVNVVGVIRLVGLWDFEIEFEVQTKEQMLKITRIIRDQFKDIIKEFEIIPLYHEYKYNFFPRDLLMAH